MGRRTGLCNAKFPLPKLRTAASTRWVTKARHFGGGYALRASDIDIIYINGYGFPLIAAVRVVCRHVGSNRFTTASVIQRQHGEPGSRTAAEATCGTGQDFAEFW